MSNNLPQHAFLRQLSDHHWDAGEKEFGQEMQPNDTALIAISYSNRHYDRNSNEGTYYTIKKNQDGSFTHITRNCDNDPQDYNFDFRNRNQVVGHPFR